MRWNATWILGAPCVSQVQIFACISNPFWKSRTSWTKWNFPPPTKWTSNLLVSTSPLAEWTTTCTSPPLLILRQELSGTSTRYHTPIYYHVHYALGLRLAEDVVNTEKRVLVADQKSAVIRCVTRYLGECLFVSWPMIAHTDMERGDIASCCGRSNCTAISGVTLISGEG